MLSFSPYLLKGRVGNTVRILPRHSGLLAFSCIAIFVTGWLDLNHIAWLAIARRLLFNKPPPMDFVQEFFCLLLKGIFGHPSAISIIWFFAR